MSTVFKYIFFSLFYKSIVCLKFFKVFDNFVFILFSFANYKENQLLSFSYSLLIVTPKRANLKLNLNYIILHLTKQKMVKYSVKYKSKILNFF